MPSTNNAPTIQEILNSSEYKIAVMLEELEAAIRLHEANYHELKLITAEIVADKDDTLERIAKIWAWDNREELEAIWKEAQRLLHNFLASAITLVDLTRKHIRRLYRGKAFYDEYESEKETRLKASPVVMFVKDLRHYNLHSRLPIVGGELSIDTDKLPDARVVRSRVCLDIGELRQRKKWTGLPKQYLQTADNYLAVDKLADDYMTVISEFYDWLRARELEIQKAPLERHRQRIARRKEESKEAGP